MPIPRGLTLLLSLFVPVALLGAPSSAAPPQEEEHEESELHESMEVVEDAMKLLRRTVREADQSARSLELLSEIQSATIRCKSLRPPMVESIPEGERAAFVTSFRRTFLDLLEAQLELERAILDGDVERARTAYKLVHDFEDSGHERFTEDED